MFCAPPVWPPLQPRKFAHAWPRSQLLPRHACGAHACSCHTPAAVAFYMHYVAVAGCSSSHACASVHGTTHGMLHSWRRSNIASLHSHGRAQQPVVAEGRFIVTRRAQFSRFDPNKAQTYASPEPCLSARAQERARAARSVFPGSTRQDPRPAITSPRQLPQHASPWSRPPKVLQALI